MRNIFLCDEMKKLREALTAMGINWQDDSTIIPLSRIENQIAYGIDSSFADTSVYRTKFTYKGVSFSVINGYSTYGGYSPFSGTNEGLLEVVASNSEEILGGWTANEVLSYMRVLSGENTTNYF